MCPVCQSDKPQVLNPHAEAPKVCDHLYHLAPQAEPSSFQPTVDYSGQDDFYPVHMIGNSEAKPWSVPRYGQSAELELVDLLYSLVLMLKPKLIVELGCHYGFTTFGLGKAAERIGAQVLTCDIEWEYVSKTQMRCRELPVHVLKTSADKLDITKADLLFLDCDYDNRISALGRMKSGAVAIIHDTRQSPELRQFPEGFEVVNFETWRGFSIVRKKAGV